MEYRINIQIRPKGKPPIVHESVEFKTEDFDLDIELSESAREQIELMLASVREGI